MFCCIKRAQLLREIERFMENPYESTVTMEEQDVMPFTIVDGGVSGIKQDRFILDASKHGANNRGFNSILERFAFSQGFAASGLYLLFSIYKINSESNTCIIVAITIALLMIILFYTSNLWIVRDYIRHSINVDCNLLNRDFYWERSELEQFYHMSARHFNLNRRLSILNGRLDYCEELVKMVDNMLALRHASTLEWMIIALIVIEVIFDIFHYVDHTPQKVIIVHEGRDENIHSLDKII
uniref:DUF155 domain-containing protein n=1 Tax=Heterorhabditis bacteriophora TaxID=37862 RepID=A0A1I7WZK0_HETBA